MRSIIWEISLLRGPWLGSLSLDICKWFNGGLNCVEEAAMGTAN